MPLEPGSRIGAYEITALLGAGGMGEVYRARDTKLDRNVALKILPDSFASDADRLMRFEREAKTLASLNHPNIAAIHGLEDAGGVRALVMELVEGEDLSQPIARGPIPVDDALLIARQIAEALEAAHEAGIVHRDLKPANIKLRSDGTVKVLDFGLAKAVAAPGAASPGVSESPTITTPAMTQAGMILGTAAYMSPEQARGKAVDKRTDIWAFGCVLYEMLSGRRTFDGETITDVLGAIVKSEPDWSTLPGTTPQPIRKLLRRCLEKDVRRRLADIADARFDLDEAATAGAAEPVGAAEVTGPRPLTLVVGTALAGVAAIAVWGWVRAAGDRPLAPVTGTYVAATLGVSAPNLMALTDRFAVAPDGSAIVFVGSATGGLFLRRPSGLDATPIPGVPPNAFSPVFSPDGRWIAFSVEDALMKIPVEGGTPVLITPGKDYFINLTWGADGRIRYPSLRFEVIRSVPANGGPVETVTLGPRTWVTRAEWLPEGRLLVSLAGDGERQMAVREADGTLRVLATGWDGRLTPTGHLLYTRPEGTIWSLVAVPFDVGTATLAGDATVVARDVAVHFATPAAGTTAGDLFYVGGTARSERRVVMVDRTGAEQDILLSPGAWVSLNLSADGQQVALARWEGARRTIWALTLTTGALTQITYAEDTFAPVWMPDGRRVLFTHFPIDPGTRSSSMWSALADGGGRVDPLSAQSDAYPSAASGDGRTLFYHVNRSDQVQADIYALALGAAGAAPTALVATPASEQWPKPSPDGRWLAYATNASGIMETRVAALTDLATSVQVSTQGGEPVRWSPDGARLFYRDGDTISVVGVGPRGPMPASRRVAFRLPRDSRGPVDVMPDGEHAVMIRGGLIYSDLVVAQRALTPR